MTITLPWADVNNKKVCAQSVLELFDQINASGTRFGGFECLFEPTLAKKYMLGIGPIFHSIISHSSRTVYI